MLPQTTIVILRVKTLVKEIAKTCVGSVEAVVKGHVMALAKVVVTIHAKMNVGTIAKEIAAARLINNDKSIQKYEKYRKLIKK